MEVKDKHLPHPTNPTESLQPDQADLTSMPELELVFQELVIEAYLTQMELFDPALLQQSRSVTQYALLIARRHEFTPEDERKLEHSSLLHDLGMMCIDRRIITKRGKLTSRESQRIRTHPLDAVRILSTFRFFEDVIPIIKHHHEWYDGTGYPDRLVGEEIPLMSRIIMIADAFVAMTSERPYRAALTVNEALGIINENQGTQFDPTLVPLFNTVVAEDLPSSSLSEACHVAFERLWRAVLAPS